MGPQGYRSASPRVALSKPTIPTFFSYPDNLLSPLQYHLSSPNVNGLLTVGIEGTGLTPRTPATTSPVTCSLNVRALLAHFSFSQKRTCNLLSLDLGRMGPFSTLLTQTAYPASVWSFRPSVFSQNMLYVPAAYLSSAGFQLVALSLFSFYNHTLNLTHGNFDLSSVRSGV